jgi:manganese transport protein
VILSFQLPFAMVPLMLLTSDARKMGSLVNGLAVKIVGWAIVLLITGLNAYLIVTTAMPNAAPSS